MGSVVAPVVCEVCGGHLADLGLRAADDGGQVWLFRCESCRWDVVQRYP